MIAICSGRRWIRVQLKIRQNDDKSLKSVTSFHVVCRKMLG